MPPEVCRPWAALDIFEDLQGRVKAMSFFRGHVACKDFPMLTTVAFLDSLRSPFHEKHEAVPGCDVTRRGSCVTAVVGLGDAEAEAVPQIGMDGLHWSFSSFLL